MKGVLNHSRNRINEIRKNQPNRQSGETFRIMSSLSFACVFSNCVMVFSNSSLFLSFLFFLAMSQISRETITLDPTASGNAGSVLADCRVDRWSKVWTHMFAKPFQVLKVWNEQTRKSLRFHCRHSFPVILKLHIIYVVGARHLCKDYKNLTLL
jgi:hypothetical protein